MDYKIKTYYRKYKIIVRNKIKIILFLKFYFPSNINEVPIV